MGKTSTKFIYIKTCSECLRAYWTTAKRTPNGLCTSCWQKSDKKRRRPVGNLTDLQAKKYLAAMKKNCKQRITNDRIKKDTKTNDK